MHSIKFFSVMKFVLTVTDLSTIYSISNMYLYLCKSPEIGNEWYSVFPSIAIFKLILHIEEKKNHHFHWKIILSPVYVCWCISVLQYVLLVELLIPTLISCSVNFSNFMSPEIWWLVFFLKIVPALLYPLNFHNIRIIYLIFTKMKSNI